MNIEAIRAVLAITIVVGVFMVSALLILGGVQDGTKIMKEFSAVFSGIVGTIIGFYFGKDKPTNKSGD